MCTCCTAPLTVTLRRRGVPPASALAYWLGKPRMIRIFHALLLVVWALPLSTCAGAISEGRLTLARGTESYLKALVDDFRSLLHERLNTNIPARLRNDLYTLYRSSIPSRL
jgi:hypothetical protein